jgi:hypothetical protein
MYAEVRCRTMVGTREDKPGNGHKHMNDITTATMIACLKADGWFLKDELLKAPNETIWIRASSLGEPWIDYGEENGPAFLAWARNKLLITQRRLGDDPDAIGFFSDLQSLIECLEHAYDR